MDRIVRRVWWLAAVLAGVSCGMPRTHYYTIELPHTTHVSAAPINRRIAIRRFRAEDVLMDNRILYREGRNEVNFYEYHLWASPPVDIATSYFSHLLKDSGAYVRVASHSEETNSDYTLHGRLEHFEETDQPKGVFASVALELELVDVKSRAAVWREEAECTRPLKSRDIAGVVGGIYECLDETARKLLGSMQRRIELAGRNAAPSKP